MVLPAVLMVLLSYEIPLFGKTGSHHCVLAVSPCIASLLYFQWLLDDMFVPNMWLSISYNVPRALPMRVS